MCGGGGGNNALLISKIFRIYYPQIKAKLKESKQEYRLGEWLLYEELVFCNTESQSANEIAQKHFNANTQPINYTIKTLKESFLKTSRLDSEYYQTKYEQNENLIKSQHYARLGDLVEIKKSIEPGSEAYRESGIPFIRVSNLSHFGINQSEIYLDSADFNEEELKNLYPKKDMILLSKDGSIGLAYCLEKDLECITSGAILHLQIKDKSLILPQYLTLILNSLTTELQAERDSGGSIIAHWKLDEIKNVLIPILNKQIQQTIESKIIQSFALRTEAKILLEKAKAKVEEAIRKS